MIVYTSVHHRNTGKVAKVMAEELKADLAPCNGIKPGRVREEQRDDTSILAVISGCCTHRCKVQQV